MKATDGIIYGEIRVNNSMFILNHSIHDIKSENQFNVSRVLCNNLLVIESATIPKNWALDNTFDKFSSSYVKKL